MIKKAGLGARKERVRFDLRESEREKKLWRVYERV